MPKKPDPQQNPEETQQKELPVPAVSTTPALDSTPDSASTSNSSSIAPYREITVASVVLGVILGVTLTASMTYAGLVIGFVVPASAIAAIVGWGVLRGLWGRGTIVENNINQTVASAINATAGGVIFTFPALFLLPGASFSSLSIVAAAAAGSLLGTLFIIPLRKQMIELERLRFPWGIAVAEILRSPGAGARKSLLLLVAALGALAFALLTNFGFLPRKLPLGQWLGLPPWVPCQFALSLLSVGAGYISGRPGLIALAGGILASWVIGPLVVSLGWLPVPAQHPQPDKFLAQALHGEVIRPLGIGFLMGGALAGVLVALPMLRAAWRSMRAASLGQREELSLRAVLLGLVGALFLLGLSAYFSDPTLSLWRLLLTALLGTLWMWLAGIIVAQCAGLTGWSPISGMALLAVALILVVVGGGVGTAVLVGAAVCVAISQGADMMNDLKTGHLLGSSPRRQQIVQLATGWIGPVVAVLTVYLIWKTMGFGPNNPSIPAPQAATLQGMIVAVQGGEVPADKYLIGALVGGLLTLAAGGGVGVLIGLSMYLPIFYILPYGLGCLLAMAAEKTLGRPWNQERGVPLAAGLLVGGSLAGVIFALIRLGQSLGGAP